MMNIAVFGHFKCISFENGNRSRPFFQKIYAAASTSTWYRRYKEFKIGSFLNFLGHKNRLLHQKIFNLFFYESSI
jgi:hypothetical protein